jgi:hypothetical protein
VVAVNAAGQPTTSDMYVISGTSASADWSWAEGAVMPGIGFGITGRPNQQIGVNSAGDVAMRVTTDAPATANDIVVRYNRATADFTLIAQERTPVPHIPTESHSGFFDSVTLFENGGVAYRSGSTTGPLPSDQSDFIFLGGSVNATILQSGVFAPGNQFNGTTGLVIDFFDESYVAADGVSHMVECALASPAVPAENSRALMVNLNAVLQSGEPVPGLNGELAPSGLVDEARMYPGGDWAYWGASTVGTYFLVVNGALRVKEGDAVPGLPGELILSIGYVSMNARGDLAYSADLTTPATGQRRTAIIVDTVEAEPVVVVTTFRSTLNLGEATRVDLDNDGTADEAYCAFLTDDTVSLAEDGTLYFVMRVVNENALTRADGLFAVSTETGCAADFNGDGFLDFFDYDAYVECFEGGACPPGSDADFNGDGFADFFDYDAFVLAFEAGC